jgi:radical SAM superfamily enzyme YgiQ (UPF0313 family)
MNIVLISTYELGRQPFGLASAAAWLRARGHEVVCADLAVDRLPLEPVRAAHLVAFYLPMHTATRLAAPVIGAVRRLNPDARLCCFGLYAPQNESWLRTLGIQDVIGGEFEQALCDIAAGEPPPVARLCLDRLRFLPPERSALPPLDRYAKLRVNGQQRLAGYTEASRGCKHRCRHCPVVPVYRGAFRIVQPDVVLADIRQQVAAGAEHITFGDPDFLNGPRHALRLIDALHREFPHVSYDVTIKIEHLLRHREIIPRLKETGCAFVTSAVESLDDSVLAKLDKGHTRGDFYEVVALFRSAGLRLNPTFIAFTPWTTRESYLDLLRSLVELDLVDAVAPVQLALRLLITSSSRLLELDEIRALTEEFDSKALIYPWRHPDPEMDELASEALRAVYREQKAGASRRAIFRKIAELAGGPALPENFDLVARAAIPYLDEPWYC